MSPKAVTVDNLFSTLNDDYDEAIKFIEFLSNSRKTERAQKSVATLKEIQGMFSDDQGWDSEESMIEDMAEFRRERMGL